MNGYFLQTIKQLAMDMWFNMFIFESCILTKFDYAYKTFLVFI